MRIFAGLAICCLALTSCDRERRDARPAPVRTVVYDGAARESDLEPGGPKSQPTVANPFYGSAYDISEGQRLYQWYNCVGCHANGGGAIGPALMDDEWTYGSLPQQIFASIAEGRPNGMPSWKHRLTNQQIWQLVAYVRSLSGLTPKSPRPGREDHMMVKPAPMQTPNAKPKNSGLPGSAQRP